MNKDIVKGNWTELKGKVKEQWGKLTDDDITQLDGSNDRLLGKLQQVYGHQKEKAQEEINAFLKKNNCDCK